MPLSKDEKGGGTEADGRACAEYCSHCYLGGAFTDPTLTAKPMMERMRGKLKDRHIPAFLAKSIVKDIPMLDRWAKR